MKNSLSFVASLLVLAAFPAPETSGQDELVSWNAPLSG